MDIRTLSEWNVCGVLEVHCFKSCVEPWGDSCYQTGCGITKKYSEHIPSLTIPLSVHVPVYPERKMTFREKIPNNFSLKHSILMFGWLSVKVTSAVSAASTLRVTHLKMARLSDHNTSGRRRFSLCLSLMKCCPPNMIAAYRPENIKDLVLQRNTHSRRHNHPHCTTLTL